MGYEVLARKWRPQLFEDVVGQRHVTDTLSNAIKQDRLAHAYLFVGPRGIGKTSIARIFAKALNCEKGPTVTPCGKCDSCREIAAGTNLDVLEIDGASNNGVEQVRDLRDSVMYAPARGKYKIYIIDEVHMLSNAAFNALLKTLEEPPAHVKFFFATTEPDKILTTIISRCQRFDLKRIAVTEIVERLRLIASEESVSVSEDALIAVARGAEGGLRDAESALDQLIAFRGSSIDEEDVLAVFGLVSRTGLEALAEGVLKGDLKSVIRLVDDFDRAGKDLTRLLGELVDHFRSLLVALNVDQIDEVMELTPGQKDVIKQQASLTDTAKLLRVMGVLSQASDRLRFTLSPKTLLETALIKAGRVATVVSLEEILREINLLKGSIQSDPKKKDDRLNVAAEEPAPDLSAKQDRPGAADKEPEADALASEGQHTLPAAPDAGGLLEKVIVKWGAVVDKVGLISVAAKAGLADARPVRVEGSEVVIGFDPDFAHEMDRFKNLRNRKALEKALERELGRKVSVSLEVAKGSFPVIPQTDTAASGDGAGRKPAEAEGRGVSGKKRTKNELIDEPSVQKALEMFDGSIMEIRD